jgi:hypothetical protein
MYRPRFEISITATSACSMPANLYVQVHFRHQVKYTLKIKLTQKM